jgi:hypothetical protein
VTDIVLLTLTAGFFGCCALLIRACDGIIGPDGPTPSDGLQPETADDEAERAGVSR